jgi:peptidyl-prolyl cis-trans isomerase B (cyclophilin B)
MRDSNRFWISGVLLTVAWLGIEPIRAAAKEEVAVVHTRLGKMVFRFFPAEAPGHVAYVKELIRRGYYDGTTFHRVIPFFVIQGGDPNSKDADRSNDGDGEADRRLKAEFSTTLHYRPGTVGMARDADPDSGSCQFFVALENIPRLDGKYTIFGELISGLEVARAIAEVPRDLKDNPLEPVPMTVKLEMKRVPPAILSLKDGPTGEVLTGPGKPKPYDPGDVRWKAPALESRGSAGKAVDAPAGEPLDLCINEQGVVLDVRFSRLDTPNAATLENDIKKDWRFRPALLDGIPVKCRFSVEGPGYQVSPSGVPGTPVESGSSGLTLPQVIVTVSLPPEVITPEKKPLLRLTLDETGQVSDVSVQSSCGDKALDEAAVSAARSLAFTPVLRGKEPVAVYLNVTVKWREAPTP